ncbi:MAG: hypothetical protein R3B09_34010, partial [Nannocystaceae bacterium]
MKKTFTTALAATAIFGITACSGGSAAGTKLIPEQATVLIGIDIGGLTKTSLYADNKAMLDQAGDAKEMMEAAKGCNIELEKMGSLLIGTDAAEPKPNVTVVFTGEGVGDEKNLTCIAEKAKEKSGKVPFTIADEGGRKVLKMDDDDGIGYIVDAKTVVIATKAWAGPTKDLIEGKGKSAADGPNKDLFARADQKKHIWFAGLIPAAAAGQLKGSPAEGVKDFSGSLDLSNGVAVTLAAGVESADKAKELKDMAEKQYAMVKGMSALIGVPASVADSVKFDTSGNAISVSASATPDDIKAIKEGAGKMMGMGMGM